MSTWYKVWKIVKFIFSVPVLIPLVMVFQTIVEVIKDPTMPNLQDGLEEFVDHTWHLTPSWIKSRFDAAKLKAWIALTIDLIQKDV